MPWHHESTINSSTLDPRQDCFIPLLRHELELQIGRLVRKWESVQHHSFQNSFICLYLIYGKPVNPHYHQKAEAISDRDEKLKKLQALVARQKFSILWKSAVRQMEFVLILQEVGALNLRFFVLCLQACTGPGVEGPVFKLLERHPSPILQRECKGIVATSKDVDLFEELTTAHSPSSFVHRRHHLRLGIN